MAGVPESYSTEIVCDLTRGAVGRPAGAETLFPFVYDELRREVFGAGHRALGWNCYNRACVRALKDDREAAIDALREALAVGCASDLIFSDGDLDSLRGAPEFQAILDEVRRRL